LYYRELASCSDGTAGLDTNEETGIIAWNPFVGKQGSLSHIREDKTVDAFCAGPGKKIPSRMTNCGFVLILYYLLLCRRDGGRYAPQDGEAAPYGRSNGGRV
jgi:hypothetical protein